MTSSNPKCLVAADIGNTLIHLGLFDSSMECADWQPSRTLQLETSGAEMDSIGGWLAGTDAVWYVSSVNRPIAATLYDWIQQNVPNAPYQQLSHGDVPLIIDLPNPGRIGMDRLAAAVAADALRERFRAAIVIDTGSAITVDVVSAEGHFLGGAILPGMAMASKSLQRGTDQLPRVSLGEWSTENVSSAASRLAHSGQSIDAELPVIGTSTEDAIRSGLFWGTVGALRWIVAAVRSELPSEPHLYFTGGDARKLAPHVDSQGVWLPNLVLTGIALIARRKWAKDSSRWVRGDAGSE